MKAVTIVFMLLASSYGLMAKEKLNDQTIPLALNEIDSSFFGKTLLDVIQIQLHSTGAIQQVIDLLDEIAEDLRNAQQTADDDWYVRGGECNSTRTSYETTIAAAQNAETVAQNRIDNELTPLIDSLTNEIADLEGKIAHNADEQSNAVSEREAANELFGQRSFETADAIAACEEALLLMAQLVNEPASTTLIQTATSTFATLESKFKSLKTGSAYAPLVMSLVALVSQQNFSDQGMVQRIIDLIAELKADLEKTGHDLENAERQEVEDHEEVMRTLQESHDSMSSRLDNARIELDNAKAAKESEEETVLNSQNTITTTTTLLNDHNQTCEDEANIYQSETAERNDELDIVAQVRVLFVDMETNTSQYVKDRTQEEFDLLSA